MRYLIAIDPGDTTGIAVLNFDNGDLVSYTMCAAKDADTVLTIYKDTYPATKVVWENFRILPHKAYTQAGSTVETAQVIGVIKSLWPESMRVEQKPQDKNIGAKVSGMKPPSNHKLGHWIDAYNQGYYFLNKIGKAKHRRNK